MIKSKDLIESLEAALSVDDIRRSVGVSAKIEMAMTVTNLANKIINHLSAEDVDERDIRKSLEAAKELKEIGNKYADSRDEVDDLSSKITPMP